MCGPSRQDSTNNPRFFFRLPTLSLGVSWEAEAVRGDCFYTLVTRGLDYLDNLVYNSKNTGNITRLFSSAVRIGTELAVTYIGGVFAWVQPAC